MKRKTKYLLQCLCIMLTLIVTVVYAEETSVSSVTDLIEYDVVYTVTTTDNIITMNVVFTVYNGKTETVQPFLIAAIYDVDRMVEIKIEKPTITSGATINEELSIIIPNDKLNDYYVKLFALEGLDSLRPLGKYKTVNDIDPYLREKLTYVTATENTPFKLYMNASTVKGGNSDSVHVIKYDATKIAPVDLCGFTFENELTAAEIPNTNIVIESVDTTNGVIRYKFLTEEGRNTGINNIIKFKALTSITDEEIKYTIQ